jgi:hypothetical protein
MKLSIDNSKFAIYDDVLTSQEYSNLWDWQQKEEYSTVHSTQWQKVWRISDGQPLYAKSYRYAEAPFNNPLDYVVDMIDKLIPMHPHLCNQWNDVTLRSYIYPRGTKIDWHTDDGYTAAAIFYTHPVWKSHWGGELKIAETPKNFEYKKIGGQVDTDWREEALNTWAVGQYITPKPNRLAITTGGIWHCINRVDADAGDNCRCSIVCFFKNLTQ